MAAEHIKDTESTASLRIVMTGGGSGGHITPILAVAHELKQLRPDCQIIYVGQRGDALGDVPAQDPNIDAVYTVRAGKFRRYHGEGLRQLLDLPTTLKNGRDGAYVAMGIGQSYRLLKQLQPQVVFVKGGFVGVPVGLAAARLGIPYITHDSDAIPGLANRLIARWAARHAVALPREIYQYPANKTVTVGVPISHKYQPADEATRKRLRRQLGLEAYDKLLLVTGGGLGAQRLNEAVIANAPDLLACYPGLAIVHLAGRAQVVDVREKYNKALKVADHGRVIVHGFVANLYDYGAAADVVITRAGGTSIAEFAAQAKACVVVPNPLLTGGHQLKNAQALVERDAIKVVDEAALAADPQALAVALRPLLDDPQAAERLGRQLHSMAQPDAARRLAMVLLEEAGQPAGEVRGKP